MRGRVGGRVDMCRRVGGRVDVCRRVGRSRWRATTECVRCSNCSNKSAILVASSDDLDTIGSSGLTSEENSRSSSLLVVALDAVLKSSIADCETTRYQWAACRRTDRAQKDLEVLTTQTRTGLKSQTNIT
jgi:hypothetical protein